MATLKQDADHARRLAETVANDELQKELMDIAAELLREDGQERAVKNRRGQTQRTTP
jgi:hypothetical protein